MTNQGWSAESFLQASGGAPSGFPVGLLRLAAPLAVLWALAFYTNGWYQPLEFKWLGVAGLAAGGFATLALAFWRGQRLRFDAIDATVGAFLAWAGLSLFWSTDPIGGLDTLFKLVLLAGIFLALRRSRDAVLERLIAVAVVGAALAAMLIERLGLAGFGGYFNQNYQTEMLVAAVPFMALAHRIFDRPALKWPFWAVAGLTVAYLLLLNRSKMEFVALPAMLFAAAMYFAWRRSRAATVGLLAAAALLFALLGWLGWENGFAGLTGSVKDSVLPRIELGTNTLQIWLASPLWGNGAGSYTALYPQFQTAHEDILNFSTGGSGMLSNQAIILMQAHNDWLQLLAVFGLVGVAILLAGVVLACRQGLVQPGATAAARTGGLAVAGICANALIDFPLQNAATALLMAIACAWLFRARPTEEAESPAAPAGSARSKKSMAASLVLALLVGFAGFWGYRLAQAHQAYTYGVSQLFRNPETGYNAFLRAVDIYPFELRFRAQIYMALSAMEDLTKQRQPDREHATAFGISLSTGPQTVVLIPRLKYLYNQGDYGSAEVQRWRTHLRKNAPMVPGVWLQEALFELRNGNRVAAQAALARLDALGGPQDKTDYMLSLVDSIRQEVEMLPVQ